MVKQQNWKVQFPTVNRSFESTTGILYNSNNIDLLKKFPDKSIDLVVTSPPYDNLRTYNKNIDKIWNFDIFKQLAIQLSRVLKVGGIIVWVVGDATIDGSETGTSFRQALYFKDVCNLNIHDTMIYEKAGFSNPSSNRYHQIFEYMFIFSKGKPKTFNPIIDRKNRYSGSTSWGKNTARKVNGELSERKDRNIISDYGQRYNIWKYANGKGFGQKDDIAYQHPATFPEQLAYDHIISWSNKHDIVLDPFMGSGTTAKQCILTDRYWIGIEINVEYCEIIQKRLQKYKLFL